MNCLTAMNLVQCRKHGVNVAVLSQIGLQSLPDITGAQWRHVFFCSYFCGVCGKWVKSGELPLFYPFCYSDDFSPHVLTAGGTTFKHVKPRPSSSVLPTWLSINTSGSISHFDLYLQSCGFDCYGWITHKTLLTWQRNVRNFISGNTSHRVFNHRESTFLLMGK